MAIRAYLDAVAFEPEDIEIMSLAFEDACKALEVPAGAAREREAIAVRIVELTRRGERSPSRLVERILGEAGLSAAGGRRRAAWAASGAGLKLLRRPPRAALRTF